MQQGKQEKNLYYKDFFAWTQQQAYLIQKKAIDKLDLIHLQEELKIMGASEKRELTHRLELLLMHLLKWKHQPNSQSNSWKYTIKEQRKRIKYYLEDNPSLSNPEHFKKTFIRAYESAIYDAVQETGLPEKTFPKKCEWLIEQVLDDSFLPK